MSCLNGCSLYLGDPGWGDPWFPAWSFVASITHQRWPFGVFWVCSGLFLVLGHSQNDKCHHACNSHCWSRFHPCRFCLVFVLVVCFSLFLLVVFGLLSWLFSCWDSFWTAYWSTTGTFVAFYKLTALHVNYNSPVCRD